MSFLNQGEINWLHQLPQPIKIGITFMPNQILVDKNGTYKGFSIDLFQKIKNVVGIKFEYVYFDTWNEVLAAGKRGTIDIIFLAQKTGARLSYFHFTDAVITQNNKIITKVNKGNNLVLENLFGLKVAISEGSALFEYLKHNFPSIRLVPTVNEEQSLSLVNKDQADAAILESVRASYYLRKLNIKNLRISGDIGYDYHLRIATRKDLANLNVILTKAIDALSNEDIQALHLKWGYIKGKDSYFDKQTLIYFGIVFSIIISFTLYILFLNKHLREEVAKRNATLQDLRVAHNQIQHLKKLAEQEARTDYLTNVLNKRGFREALYNHVEKHKRTQQVFSLVLFDIDYFKKINDKMGHDTGDRVLEDFAKIVKNTLRPYDKIGRVGGEEFALIFPSTHLTEAVEITERIKMMINDYIFTVNQFTFQITASFGVAEITTNDSATSLFKKADDLLYKSKTDGRNRVSF